MAYARFSRGYKSGGYNNTQSNPGFNPTKPFGPETLDQVEIGAKTELFDRLRLNFAIFQMDYADIQLQITNPITFEKYVDNAGDVRSKGAEVEFSTASFAGLSFFGNAGLQHSKYTEIKPGGTVSLVGKAISYAPKATASLGAEYVTDLPSGLQFRSSVNASYRSDMWLDNNNTTKSPAVTLVNARLGIEQADGRWGVFLWGANLGDSLRITATTGAKAGLMQGAARVSTPRTFGLEIRGSF
jgi:iron complex outermembrane receptor protein